MAGERRHIVAVRPGRRTRLIFDNSMGPHLPEKVAAHGLRSVHLSLFPPQERALVMERSDFVSCPRGCGVDVCDHDSSGLIDDWCEVGSFDVPLLDVGGYLACGCHGSQRDHTCMPLY